MLCALLAPVAVLGIVANDRFLRHGGGHFLYDALTDEPAHAVTALLVVGAVAAWRRAWRIPVVWIVAIVGGTAIDLDHLPDFLGWHYISAGTERPHTHALPTLMLLLGIALSQHGLRRRALLAAALGLTAHYVRDLVEGSTLPLLWPGTTHGFSAPYGSYAAVLVVCAGMIVAGMWRRHGRGLIGRGIVATTDDLERVPHDPRRHGPVMTASTGNSDER
jgi:hypothetical protein